MGYTRDGWLLLVLLFASVDSTHAHIRISNQQATFSKWFSKNEITWHKLLNNNNSGVGSGSSRCMIEREWWIYTLRDERGKLKRTCSCATKKKSEFDYTVLNCSTVSACVCVCLHPFRRVLISLELVFFWFFFLFFYLHHLNGFFFFLVLLCCRFLSVCFISPDLCIKTDREFACSNRKWHM